jgi:tight adherence protein B
MARHEALAQSAGVALSGLLQALAEATRLQQGHLAQLKISALPNRLMLPIGLSVLPAFVLIAVIPVVLNQFGRA